MVTVGLCVVSSAGCVVSSAGTVESWASHEGTGEEA